MVLRVKSQKSVNQKQFDLPLIHVNSGAKAFFQVLCVDHNRGFLLNLNIYYGFLLKPSCFGTLRDWQVCFEKEQNSNNINNKNTSNSFDSFFI